MYDANAYLIDKAGDKYFLQDLDFDLSEPEDEVTVEGWVARDCDGDLFIYRARPEREDDYWTASCEASVLPKDKFPSVTWESEPLDVTITIKPKKK